MTPGWVAGIGYKPGWRFRVGGPGNRFLCVFAGIASAFCPATCAATASAPVAEIVTDSPPALRTEPAADAAEIDAIETDAGSVATLIAVTCPEATSATSCASVSLPVVTSADAALAVIAPTASRRADSAIADVAPVVAAMFATSCAVAASIAVPESTTDPTNAAPHAVARLDTAVADDAPSSSSPPAIDALDVPESVAAAEISSSAVSVIADDADIVTVSVDDRSPAPAIDVAATAVADAAAASNPPTVTTAAPEIAKIAASVNCADAVTALVAAAATAPARLSPPPGPMPETPAAVAAADSNAVFSDDSVDAPEAVAAATSAAAFEPTINETAAAAADTLYVLGPPASGVARTLLKRGERQARNDIARTPYRAIPGFNAPGRSPTTRNDREFAGE